MNRQRQLYTVQSRTSTNFKSFLQLFGIGVFHLLFTFPVAIPLVLSIYIIIGGFYLTSILLLLSPIIFFIHYLFPSLPISIGIGMPSVISELLLTVILFIVGFKLMKVTISINQSFHLKVKKMSVNFKKWNLSYLEKNKFF